ncbi:hypothetical protein EYF80_047330 [Liparis tanakae]|uniref:Uncharacterized protein n=1 Tax=Liparis tanakae TaxID=230148 RepID=A0A4Z2FMP2_9TELE|nr:hypothetical protein EYF80_047330 [Liparis tanakae]
MEASALPSHSEDGEGTKEVAVAKCAVVGAAAPGELFPTDISMFITSTYDLCGPQPAGQPNFT